MAIYFKGSNIEIGYKISYNIGLESLPFIMPKTSKMNNSQREFHEKYYNKLNEKNMNFS